MTKSFIEIIIKTCNSLPFYALIYITKIKKKNFPSKKFPTANNLPHNNVKNFNCKKLFS